MASVVVKAYLEYPDSSVETRRFNVDKETVQNVGLYNRIYDQVAKAFPALKGKIFTLFWKDDEDDFVTVSTDEEVQEVLSQDMGKFYIKVNGDQNHTGPSDQEATSEQEMMDSGDKGNHDVTDPLEDAGVNSAEIDSLLPPFAFHGWGGPRGWGGRGKLMGRHKRGGPFDGPGGCRKGPKGHHHHEGPWDHHHHGGRHGGHWGSHHGGHWDSHQGGHCGPHHGGRWGPHHGGHWGPHHGGHWGPHHRGHKGCHFDAHGKHFKSGCKGKDGKKCCGGKKGWKNGLRDLVPKSHRRWAKSFIQNWRKENLKNATTTTSSDSDDNADWKAKMTKVGIPEVYADWLRLKLICWHSKWTKEEMENILGDETFETHQQAKDALKSSVLHEFRNWVNWYLNRHFGERKAPKFKRNFSGCDHKDMIAMKKKAFENSVPKGYQLWTKRFIQEWRAERKLEDPFTDKDGMDSDMNIDEAELTPVPDPYKEWLTKFLLRWHTWRGQLQRQPGQDMRGFNGEFKNSVPMDYRGWVKFYMSYRYTNNKFHCKGKDSNEDDTQKYNKMLQAFQKLWLQQQNEGTTMNEDGRGAIAFNSDDDHGDSEPFQMLGSSSDSDSDHRRVRFDRHSEKKQWKRMKKQRKEDFRTSLFDEDDDDMQRFHRKVPMNYGFRQWVKQALSEWDGKSSNDDSEVELELPPNVYYWMAKIMMKNQKKKLKQERKDAKKESKEAKKDMKAIKN